ncbi:MAG: hypothetical protein IAG13_17540, partial [Deltaproteobacteria bacterium]|nr:hypothetical protein [Nannocystaceae bacterium]
MGDVLRGRDDARYVGCGPDTGFARLVADSRKVGPGALFVALAGGAHDGHGFVDEVLARGAAAVVIQRGRIAAPAGPHVWLDDTWAAL